MIKEITDKNQIVPLWQQAFGDSEEDILYFADNVTNAKCFGYFCNNKPVSMLYLVACKLGDNNAHYIYAACTLKEFQGNGYMSKLIDYCQFNFGDICLIPAKEGLIDYYSKRKFAHKADISSVSFQQQDLITQYLFEGCELQKPFLLVFRR